MNEALYLNGMHESVLDEILKVQRVLPDQVMFIQPFSSKAIALLRDNPPTPERPTLLLMSLTTDLPSVSFAAEVVGWHDKTKLSAEWRHVLNRLIWTLQPDQGGLYDQARDGGESVNLLHVRRLRRLSKPVGVTQFVKTADGSPLSDQRTTSGGWSYIRPDGLADLLV